MTEDGTRAGEDQILIQDGGFPLRGSDENGYCYYVRNTEDGELEAGEFGYDLIKAETVNEPLYYDDPLLSFHDSMIYGCRMDLNLEEL